MHEEMEAHIVQCTTFISDTSVPTGTALLPAAILIHLATTAAGVTPRTLPSAKLEISLANMAT